MGIFRSERFQIPPQIKDSGADDQDGEITPHAALPGPVTAGNKFQEPVFFQLVSDFQLSSSGKLAKCQLFHAPHTQHFSANEIFSRR